MKFCAKLCNDINFEADAIQPCCNVHNTRVPRFAYNGGPVDIGKYASHIQSVAYELQSGTDLCKGCPDLVELDESKDFDIGIDFKNILINMHRHMCNCRCTYCSLWKTVKHSYPVLPGLKSLVQQQVVNRDCLVSWGGGEPSILIEFDEASLWLARHGLRQHVFTNAIRYSASISEILKSRLGTICVSLDSASQATYKAVKQVDKYNQVISNIERYIKESDNAFGVYLKYIIFESNNSISEIDRFLNLCSRMGITNIEVSFDFREVNRGEVSQKTMIAGAFFEEKAVSLGLNCEKFFVTPSNQQKLAVTRDGIFG